MRHRFFISYQLPFIYGMIFIFCSHSLYCGVLSITHSQEFSAVVDKTVKKWNLACVMIFKDEAPYLKEWIEFHKLVGVEHFYLYNNLSSDHYLEILKPYIDAGDVELIEWPLSGRNIREWTRIQLNAYRDAIKKSYKRATWLAIIDADEYLVPIRENNLVTLLKKYESDPQIGGVTAHWVMFGTSHIEKIPDDHLMIETLLLNDGGLKENSKSIIRPDRIETIGSPHYANYLRGINSVALEMSDLQINHYWSKDEYYLYQFKIPRSEFMRRDYPVDECIEKASIRYNRYLEPYHLPILRFILKLRMKMGLTDD